MTRVIVSVVFLFLTSYLLAQVGINTYNPHFDTDLMLGSVNKGFLPNRVELESLSSPRPLSDDLLDGVIVYNTTINAELSQALYVWRDHSWNKIEAKDRPQKDVGMLVFRQTGETDQTIIPYGESIDLKALGANFTAPRDGTIYVNAVIYTKMKVNATVNEVTIANTFFRVQIRNLTTGAVDTFIAACTPISTGNGSINNNPTPTYSLGALSVSAGNEYELKVIGEEGWVKDATITAGTYAWKTYRAYSVVKVDFVSDYYY